MTQAVTADTSSRRDDFSERTKLNFWVQVLVLGLEGSLGAAGLGLIFNDNDAAKAFGIVIIASLVVVYSVFLFIVLIWYRDAAVDQCIALTEEMGLKLNINQVLELQRLFTAGFVFQGFVGMIDTESLVQPKNNYFATSGGQTQEACRRFVLFLHKNPGEYRRTN